MFQFTVGSATDIGRKRTQNQDGFGVFPDLGLFLVADGMGGHKGGEIASAIAVQSIQYVIRSHREKAASTSALSQGGGDFDPFLALELAIKQANSSIYARSREEHELRGMGTTATCLLFHDETLYIGHVGDSRSYYFRPHSIWQLTRDHSLVQEKLRAGMISRAEVKTDAMKNVITRSVGFEPNINIDVYEMAVQPGDVFMICSDGLSGPVDDLEMLDIVQRDFFDQPPTAVSAQNTIRSLIYSANQKGGDDNITSILVQLGAPKEESFL